MRLFGLGGRMLRIAAALCLPTVAVVAFGVYFLAVDVPKIVGDERVRVAAETEKAAERLRADPSGADFKWVRGSGIVAGDKSMSGMFPATLSWLSNISSRVLGQWIRLLSKLSTMLTIC